MSEKDPDYESTFTRTKKRMLPSVAEVARELAKGTAADAASILTSARRVCADELARVKEGHESVSVETLVERAMRIIEETARPPEPVLAPPPATPPVPEPAEPAAEGADPFGETSAKLDLKWDREAAGEAPPRSRSEPGMPVSFGAEPSSPFEPSGLGPKASTSFSFNFEEPFEKTVRAPVSPGPFLAPPPPAGARRSRLPLALGAVAVLAGAGFGTWYMLRGRVGEKAPPPPLRVDRARKAPRPTPPPQPAQPTPAPAGAPQAASPAAPAAGASAAAPIASVRELAPKPAPAARKPAAVVVPSAPTPLAPAPTPAAPVPPAARAASPGPTVKDASRAAPALQSRAGSLATPDWAGDAVFVLHFSSFTDKKRAERDAARLGKEMGLPARAVQVDLGEKGLWYRAVVGEFRSVEEALALRNDLLGKKTPGVGLVYRMVAK